MGAPLAVCPFRFVFDVAAFMAWRRQAEHEKICVYCRYLHSGVDMVELVDAGILGERFVQIGRAHV